jgi:hypothetical protein
MPPARPSAPAPARAAPARRPNDAEEPESTRRSGIATPILFTLVLVLVAGGAGGYLYLDQQRKAEAQRQAAEAKRQQAEREAAEREAREREAELQRKLAAEQARRDAEARERALAEQRAAQQAAEAATARARAEQAAADATRREREAADSARRAQAEEKSREILSAGERDLAAKRFDTAIAKADAVLSMDPGNRAAAALRQRAVAAQETQKRLIRID